MAGKEVEFDRGLQSRGEWADGNENANLSSTDLVSAVVRGGMNFALIHHPFNLCLSNRCVNIRLVNNLMLNVSFTG